MVQSLNTKVDLVTKATSYSGLTDYGKVMIGDKAFEFYHDRDKKKYIQIPWEEVEFVAASVMFKGKWIPRYVVKTKNSGSYTFASKDPKKVLKAINVYIPSEKLVHSLSFGQVITRGVKAIFKKKK